MRNTKVFNEAVAQTLAELARLGVTVRPGAVADIIEANMTEVAARLGIQERSAWRYFDSAGLATAIAQQQREFEESSDSSSVGVAPMPPVDNPELALLLAGVPDSLAQTGGDLYAVMINLAVNAWMAGHIHGEDGCEGCEGSRGPSGHDWNDRMKQITAMSPDITQWFDRDRWNAALHDSGFSVERR
ncbi:hypothetical protein [Kitasatospora sp. NBC_01300]|uniref:hypothetical protein n=1 Tax=Kitasatospora sp. NBC_01300 TaxID=2903574 RepID=UPI00352E11F3|nr:hypothetical protein OG556_39990 [Kitasatospora sp. NBC_01300]